MINEQLFHLYASRIQGINALYADRDAKDITDYVGPLLPYCWEEQYLKSKHQLVVFGQETNGWYCDYMNSEEEIRKNIQMYKDFSLGTEYNSLFWQYAHWFNKELNEFDEQNFVWLNINKFGSDSGVGRPEQEVLDDEVRFYNLLADELSILKPDVCLFFTGPNYDQDILRKLPDVKFHEFGGFGLREVARLSSKHLPLHSYRTYHPGYGNRISDSYQRMLDAIMDACKR